jgi:hypothetical protein
MLSSAYPDCPQTNNNTVNISPLATLAIAMTIQVEAKSKKRTKYRPVKRPDGVVVLQRPYRPAATSLSLQAPIFEKHLPTFIVPASIAKPNRVVVMKRLGEDLVGIGGDIKDADTEICNEMAETGRGGYHDLVEAGRDGYNDQCGTHDRPLNPTEELRRLQKDCQGTPMQRFLSEAGPWSALNLRDI